MKCTHTPTLSACDDAGDDAGVFGLSRFGFRFRLRFRFRFRHDELDKLGHFLVYFVDGDL